MTKPASRIWLPALFLFCSGASALIYQTVWMRDFRLIFGASTVATGAVLAIFMGGLGVGSALLGKRADKHPHPLALYGILEIGIAVSAALTPLLLMGVRAGYFAIGGSASLGAVPATLIRLLFSTLVLAIPTVLMGGTLPAMARAVESNDDAGRRRLALLYGINTLGAVAGALIATFVLLERYGNRMTLLIAAVLNLAIGGLAFVLGRKLPKQETTATPAEEGSRASALPSRLVLIAAALVGFAFLLMELVWYRMLSPLLGGTTFMFGLVLAIALTGIGIGGALYSFGNRARLATATGFAMTCTLEALCMIVPYALGDRLAVLANALRSMRVFGFSGHLISWAIITAIVVLPAAIVAGYQFPLLISLLGRGREQVGREVGLAYAWNTGGSIAASLLGSFILFPTLGARGSWKLAVGTLIALGALVLFFAMRERYRAFAGFAAASAVISLLLMFTALGPTAVWRHSGIGAGRTAQFTSPNSLREWMHNNRKATIFEKDGRESSIALLAGDDLGLIVNGKSDGSARDDAGTQVMSGILPVLVHPNPKQVLVIGLGTGTTSGWIADVPTMERVDVVELEPVVVDIATYYNPVNRNAMSNEKHHTSVGDAREVLLTTKEQYDVIFSEPSNPYRAGIASLYTRDFYTAAAQRLRKNGLFVQWMQMYSIDTRTMKTIYGTITSVFPNVDTWTTTEGDIVLVASRDPIVYDANQIRSRLAQEPYRSGTHYAWRAESAEGVMAHFVASEKLATAAGADAQLNTDDRQVIEFSFARSLGRDIDLMNELVGTARRLNAARPTNVRGTFDWAAVDANRASMSWIRSVDPKNDFARKYENGDYAGALAAWRTTPWQAVNSYDNAMLGHVLADAGDDAALMYIDPLRPWQPIEAEALTGLLLYRKGNYAGAAQLFSNALTRYREDPWPLPRLMNVAIDSLAESARDPKAGELAVEALSQPFSAYLLEEQRGRAFLVASWEAKRCGPSTLTALREYEPNVPWRASVLQMRTVCYAAANLPALNQRAQEDLLQFSEGELQRIAK